MLFYIKVHLFPFFTQTAELHIIYVQPTRNGEHCNLGPLHTQAKSRDHEIVRKPKRKCPKAVPTHLQNHVVWSRTLKISVKDICDWVLNQMLFQLFSIYAGPHT